MKFVHPRMKQRMDEGKWCPWPYIKSKYPIPAIIAVDFVMPRLKEKGIKIPKKMVSQHLTEIYDSGVTEVTEIADCYITIVNEKFDLGESGIVTLRQQREEKALAEIASMPFNSPHDRSNVIKKFIEANSFFKSIILHYKENITPGQVGQLVKLTEEEYEADTGITIDFARDGGLLGESFFPERQWKKKAVEISDIISEYLKKYVYDEADLELLHDQEHKYNTVRLLDYYCLILVQWWNEAFEEDDFIPR